MLKFIFTYVFTCIENILGELWPNISLLLAWHPNTEKTCTSTDDCKYCCSGRHSCPQWECPRTPWSSTTDTNEPCHCPQTSRTKSCCQQGWHALLALGPMTNFTAGMLEKPSVKAQILCFFGRRHVYLAVASCWCHCSNCNALWGICMISAPQVPCWSHRQELGYFTPDKREDLPNALWLPLDDCDMIKISLTPGRSSWHRNMVLICPLKVLGLSILTHPWHILFVNMRYKQNQSQLFTHLRQEEAWIPAVNRHWRRGNCLSHESFPKKGTMRPKTHPQVGSPRIQETPFKERWFWSHGGNTNI